MGVAKRRVMRQFICPAGPVFGLHSADVSTLARAICTRVLTYKGEPVLQPLPGAWELPKFFAALKKRAVVVTPYTYDEFLGCYDGRRRHVYEKAVESLLTKPVSHEDSKVRPFVKAEKINLTAKPDPDPRVISPRNPRYGAALGVYIKKLEPIILDKVNRVFGSRTVFKGMNAVVQAQTLRGKWEKFRNPVALGLDASRFDQHVSINALMFEQRCYNLFLRDKNASALLRHQISNRATGFCEDGRVKYSVEGSRCSGDMNTGLGNCLIMCAMVYEFLALHAIKAELLNNGDDCVLILEQEDLHKLNGLEAFFFEKGFRVVFEEPVREFEKIEFCQTHPVWANGRWIMARDPRVCLAKDVATIKTFTSKKSWNTLRNSVAHCGAALGEGMPVFQSFYQCLGRGAGNRVDGDSSLKESGFGRLAAGLSWGLDRVARITEDARVSFWVAFGIHPDLQVAIESWYDSVTPTYGPYGIPEPQWYKRGVTF